MVFIAMLLFALVGQINDSKLSDISEVQNTYERASQLRPLSDEGNGYLSAGWSSKNITPLSPIHMAGYGRRGPYQSVSDSLYTKTVVISNGIMEIAIISVDLLMFPRKVKSALYDTLLQHGFTQEAIFLSATHTHNGFGNWETSPAGRLIFGNYDASNTTYLTNQIVASVLEARERKSHVRIGFQKIYAGELVYNRLAEKNGKVDPYLRAIYLKNTDNRIGLITSFSGHAVNLDADIWTLSRDYPGVLTDQLEASDSVDFAMFCAGMVGSHNINLATPKGPERVEKAGYALSQKILNSLDRTEYKSGSDKLLVLDLEVDMPPSQLRLTNTLRIRNWFFSMMMGRLNANVKLVGIGDLLLIGMPCDYSGELSVNNQLDKTAENLGKNLFITSFNGNYVGYITEDQHYYTCTHDEVMAMNWVGPHKGQYFTEIIKKLILTASR